MIVIESAGITDIGKKRQGNEDALFFDDALGLYVVADGMGGHRAGEIASKLVVDTISEYILQSQNNGDPVEKNNSDKTLSLEANRLLCGIQLSNKVVHNASLENDACRGMGSTVSAVYFANGTLIAANVGDSPIYLIRDGKIKLLSVLHTVLAEQAALNPENAQKLGVEFKHVLTRAMGTEDSVIADIYEIQCFKDDILVISSDGLSDKASPEEIMKLVKHNGSQTACQRLVELANDRGGDDNITAIVLKIQMIKNTRFNLIRLGALVNRFFNRFFSRG
ncbi:MAG: serine/threonine-protein phosphatase [Deltaproteobacteria bacterium]|jgi:protein phosphatase|nr:serine/threonine-protein phosphatase [Deltaproteobacteria bacterium]